LLEELARGRGFALRPVQAREVIRRLERKGPLTAAPARRDALAGQRSAFLPMTQPEQRFPGVVGDSPRVQQYAGSLEIAGQRVGTRSLREETLPRARRSPDAGSAQLALAPQPELGRIAEPVCKGAAQKRDKEGCCVVQSIGRLPCGVHQWEALTHRARRAK